MIGVIVLLLILFIVVFPVVALVKANEAARKVDLLAQEVAHLRHRLADLNSGQLRQDPVRLPGRSAVLAPPPSPLVPPIPEDSGEALRTPVTVAEIELAKESPAVPPPLIPPLPRPLEPIVQPVRRIAPPPAVKSTPKLSLEQFMGARLFAWVGGLALFFGIVFFVKLSIERGWLPPGLRVGIGFVTGISLLAAGWRTSKREAYAVLAHTLCATGIVVLYSVCYAAHAMYRIPPFDHALVTFAAMSLNTAAAFWLAVRLKTQVVAVLGMLGGFLTPVLCSTGVDNPFGLFSYIALLDAGVLAVARRQRWMHLVPLAAAGTILMQAGWMGEFYVSSGYAHGGATWIPVAVFLGFAALFTAAVRRNKNEEVDSGDAFGIGSAVALTFSAMVAGYAFFGAASITARPGLLYTLVLGVNALTMALAWWKPKAFPVYAVFTGLALVHLMVWTRTALTLELLPWALGIYLLFGLAHTGFALLWQKRSPGAGAPSPVIGWVPVVSLALLLLPVLWLRDIGAPVWLAVLAGAGMVMGLAFRTRQLLPVLGAFLLTFITAGAWFVRMPGSALAGPGLLNQYLTSVGGFAALFATAGALLGRRAPQDPAGRWLPVAAAILPFLLLILAVLRLMPENPTPIFGLAMGLTVFLLGLARFAGQPKLAPAALGCVLALLVSWLSGRVDPERALGWIAAFYTLFAAFPWPFRREFAREPLPWITLAAAGLGFFLPAHAVIRDQWPALEPGFIPAAFALLPLLTMEYVRRNHVPENPARPAQLAWLAGTGLFFLTVIFPVQFERQWITVGWALEGAALCWLTRRVPHPGLRGAGAGLLAAAFVRLALNPASYSGPVSVTAPMLNWQLYAFTTVTAALFAAAAWLKPAQEHLGKFPLPLPGVFRALGGILLFLLLNIEIASAFTPLGETLSLQSPGTDFARAMTTTISWSLFALALLSLGFWKRNALTRYAGIALLAAALLKLFFHDLARTGSGYRIGAFLVVALAALAASWLYQRFLTEASPPADGTPGNAPPEIPDPPSSPIHPPQE